MRTVQGPDTWAADFLRDEHWLIEAFVEPGQGVTYAQDVRRTQAEWERPYLDLDKTWRGMVTEGVDDAASRAIVGGTEMGNDIAYGPARLVTQADVRARAVELSVLLERWPAERAHLRVEVEALVEYYSEAARESRAMLVWLS